MQTTGSSSSSGPALSLLTPIGYQSGDCGYCKAEDSSQRTPNSRASYYARAKALSPQHYQGLMDRGWRRSGSLLYLPDPSRSCCPHYTIRLPTSEFKPTRDQRQALNRWNRYVLGEKYIKDVSVKFPKSKEEKKKSNNTFDLSEAVHEAETTNLKPELIPDHEFEVTLDTDTFTEEKYALYDNYQRNVHHDGDGDISKPGFKRFLCSSTIKRRTEDNEKKLGSFHQCYRLDGRLIAMGVLDLLPHAVSGVYFIYHSDFEKWSFGKLSALREAALALEQGYQYYYMGYYIHSCKKMRYKGDYKPQYVLDCHGYGWDPLDDQMQQLMDRTKYASMSRERQILATRKDSQDASNGQTSNADKKPVFPTPVEAMESGYSLLKMGMPGVLTLQQVYQTIDLDRMKVFIGRGGVHEMRYIQSWNSGNELDQKTLKGLFAEFAAAVGPTIAKEAIVDLTS